MPISDKNVLFREGNIRKTVLCLNGIMATPFKPKQNNTVGFRIRIVQIKRQGL